MFKQFSNTVTNTKNRAPNGSDPPAAAHPVIEALELTKTYKMGDMEVRALRGVDLSIQLGEMVAIMGPSGSGKSTLMNIIGCLDVPTSGLYRLDGTEVGVLDDNNLAEIRSLKIGFVFQSFNLVPYLNLAENVMLPLAIKKMPKAQRLEMASEARARVGLGGKERRLPSQVSGGEQERAAVTTLASSMTARCSAVNSSGWRARVVRERGEQERAVQP